MRVTAAQCQSAEGVPLSDTCQTPHRSEEHTSELQSHLNLVCRLLLEKNRLNTHTHTPPHSHTSTSTHQCSRRRCVSPRSCVSELSHEISVQIEHAYAHSFFLMHTHPPKITTLPLQTPFPI